MNGHLRYIFEALADVKSVQTSISGSGVTKAFNSSFLHFHLGFLIFELTLETETAGSCLMSWNLLHRGIE